jgi:caa(3)-type oxidase subunit IV
MTDSTTQAKDIADVKRHVRQHLIIAVGLVIGVVLTICFSRMNFGNHNINIAISLLIAAAQAFCIAGFFMHLMSEKKMIYSFLVFTAIFLVVQMGITIWSHLPDNVVHMR